MTTVAPLEVDPVKIFPGNPPLILRDQSKYYIEILVDPNNPNTNPHPDYLNLTMDQYCILQFQILRGRVYVVEPAQQVSLP